MHFDIEKWLMDLFDDKIHIKSADIVCHDGNALYGVVIDELGNRISLSSRNVKIFVGLMANKENMTWNSFLQLDNHPVVDFIRIKGTDVIKRMSLVINNSFDNIHRMVIIDGKGIKKEIIDKNEQQRLIELYARQHVVSVMELENMNLDTLKITKVNKIIERIDVITDEWQINNGISVEKIVVTTTDGQKKEYSNIEDIRKVFIELCRQEYLSFSDYNLCIKYLEVAYRNDFLKCVGNLSIINIIKPIYERIEIIERSCDCRLSPTKVRVVTSNHGSQVYDLVRGMVLSDTNYINDITNNFFFRIVKKTNKMIKPENREIYEMEKHFSLLYKFMRIGEFELEKSFFVEYFAEQQLREEGITRDNVTQDKFLMELQKRQKEIASNPMMVVSKVIYQCFEILEYNYDENGYKVIGKIKVRTSNNSFIIDGYKNCSEFIKKFAKMKKCNLKDLLNNNQYVVNLSEKNSYDNLEEKTKQSFRFCDLFMENVLHILDKFKLGNFQYGKAKQKKVQR